MTNDEIARVWAIRTRWADALRSKSGHPVDDISSTWRHVHEFRVGYCSQVRSTRPDNCVANVETHAVGEALASAQGPDGDVAFLIGLLERATSGLAPENEDPSFGPGVDPFRVQMAVRSER